MGIRTITKILTWTAFSFGVMSVLSCFFPSILFYGMLCTVLGTVLSIIVIFIRTHYAVPIKWNHPSVIALMLCSVPVIYVMLLIVLGRHE
jgi:hypothetical protein